MCEEHLYQLFAYLKNLRAVDEPQELGVLLCAADADHVEARFHLDGEAIWVKTLDLAQPWPCIRRDLLGVAADLDPVIA